MMSSRSYVCLSHWFTVWKRLNTHHANVFTIFTSFILRLWYRNDRFSETRFMILRLFAVHHWTKFGVKFWSTPKLCPQNPISHGCCEHTALFQLLMETSVQIFMPIYQVTFLKFKTAAAGHVGFSETWSMTTHHLRLLTSIIIPNLVQKFWSMPKLYFQNEIQNGGRRHLELIFKGCFVHITVFQLLISTTAQHFMPILQSTALI